MSTAEAHAHIDGIAEKMCAGKNRHEYEHRAERHRDDLRRKHGDEGLVVYGCVFCNGYHVGRPTTGKTLCNVRRLLTVKWLASYDFTKWGRTE